MKHVQRYWMRFWCGLAGAMFLLFGASGCNRSVKHPPGIEPEVSTTDTETVTPERALEQIVNEVPATPRAVNFDFEEFRRSREESPLVEIPVTEKAPQTPDPDQDKPEVQTPGGIDA
jgi:hypothetical protein